MFNGKKILLDLNQVLQTKEGEEKISKHEILSVVDH
jgi:inorganic pyrophosphatase/exopolyphosphatase